MPRITRTAGGAAGAAGAAAWGLCGSEASTTVPYFHSILGNIIRIDETTFNTVMPQSGTFSRLFVRVIAGGWTNNVTATVRIAGVNSAITLTILGATTGVYSDIVNTATFAAGDIVSVEYTPPNASMNTCVSLLMTFD